MELNHKKIQVAIAAKQFLYRLGIKTLLSVIGIEPEIYETNNLDSIKKALESRNNFDFIILSETVVPIPKSNYLETIKKMCPQCKLMVVGDNVIENCPCSHFVLNSDSQKDILEKFQDFFFEPDVPDYYSDNKALLSEREVDVLMEVAKGYANKEIADRLCISVNTVVTHRKNITDKLGIKTIAGLTAYALMNNIINARDVKH